MVLAAGLRARLAHEWGDPELRIDHFEKMSGGASRDTWSFDAIPSAGEPRELVARQVQPGRDFVAGLTSEAVAIKAALEAGAPAPGLIGLFQFEDLDGTGPCLVMDRVHGETIARRILRGEEFAHARAVFATQCGAILGMIHASEVNSDHERYDAFERLLEIFDTVGERRPVFELAFAWLAAHRPVCTAETLVHGDFRLGNLVVGPEGVRAVLDWEASHVGDPLEDLGWLCVKAWRFGGNSAVGGLGSYDELCSSYERTCGRHVDRGALRWWVMFETLRWGVSCVQMASWHVSGARRSVELAAIGRRACENEWDLVCMLSEKELGDG